MTSIINNQTEYNYISKILYYKVKMLLFSFARFTNQILKSIIIIIISIEHKQTTWTG